VKVQNVDPEGSAKAATSSFNISTPVGSAIVATTMNSSKTLPALDWILNGPYHGRRHAHMTNLTRCRDAARSGGDTTTQSDSAEPRTAAAK
jgi:hypothetical protein